MPFRSARATCASDFEQQAMELIRADALVHQHELKRDPTPAQGFIIINSVVSTLLRYLSLPRAPLFKRGQLVEELTRMVTGGLRGTFMAAGYDGQ